MSILNGVIERVCVHIKLRRWLEALGIDIIHGVLLLRSLKYYGNTIKSSFSEHIFSDATSPIKYLGRDRDTWYMKASFLVVHWLFVTS